MPKAVLKLTRNIHTGSDHTNKPGDLRIAISPKTNQLSYSVFDEYVWYPLAIDFTPESIRQKALLDAFPPAQAHSDLNFMVLYLGLFAGRDVTFDVKNQKYLLDAETREWAEDYFNSPFTKFYTAIYEGIYITT